MPELPPVAFFSYAHADDEHDEGRLAALCRLLQDKLEAKTGQQFPIFFDRESIEWGEFWQGRIDESLNGSTFFIPVLTPTYFERPKCREELEKFLKREQRLGRKDLVLPIYYQTCERLEDPASSADQLATTITTRQWADWRPLRLKPMDDPEVHEQVAQLVTQVVHALQRTTKRRRWQNGVFGGVVVGLLALAALVAFRWPSSAGGSQQTEPPSLSGQTIMVASRWTGPEQDNFQKVINAFKGQTDAEVTYDVEYVKTGVDAGSFIERRVDEGNPPDIVIISNPGLLGDLVGKGLLQPIEEAAGKQVDASYNRIWRQRGIVDGELYGVWFKAANKSTFWYNRDVFDAVGVQPPGTFEELKAAADTIAATGATAPIAIGGSTGWVLTDWFENVYLRTAGPDLYNQLVAHEIPWTHESVTQALTVLAEIFGNDRWIAGGAQGASRTNFEDSVTQPFSEPPRAGMVSAADFAAVFIRDRTNAVIGERAGTFPFPTIEGSVPSVIVGGDVAVMLTEDEAAAEFMHYLATPDAAKEWAEAGGLLSPNQNFKPSDYRNDLARRAAEEIEESKVLRFDLSDLAPPEFGGTPGQGMQGILQDFLRNPHDIPATQQALEQTADDAYD